MCGGAARVSAPIRKLAMITSNAGSLARFRGPLIAALVASGIEVVALAPDFTPELREEIRRRGAEPVDFMLERTGMHPLHDARSFADLVTHLRRLRPDATFAYFIKPVIYGTLAARLAGVPHRFALMAGMGYVFTPGEGGDTAVRRTLRAVVSRLLRLALASAERVFFHNRDDIAELSRLGLLDRDKAVLLGGTGIDLDHFAPGPPPTGGARRFLLVARLLREKGIEEFVAAAVRVRAVHPQARFELVGGLDSNPGAIGRDVVERWVDAGAIEWHDHVEDVRPFYRGCDVFVLPSWREGKPRSTQEAMAIGRPVITTDAVGCRDTVAEGVNGYLVPVRDPASLAAAMIKLIEDPAALSAMGRQSRRMAEELYDVHRINRTILETIGAAPAR